MNLPKFIFVREKLSHGKDVVGDLISTTPLRLSRFQDGIFQS